MSKFGEKSLKFLSNTYLIYYSNAQISRFLGLPFCYGPRFLGLILLILISMLPLRMIKFSPNKDRMDAQYCSTLGDKQFCEDQALFGEGNKEDFSRHTSNKLIRLMKTNRDL